MKPITFDDRPACRVLGVQTRIRLASANWSELWNKGYMPRVEEIVSRSTGVCGGYYFATNEPGLVDFLMGRPMKDGVDVPEGLTVREVPAARLAVFECGMAEIGATWHAIFGDWLPRSGYVQDAAAPPFEEFVPDKPVRILVPVKPA